MFEIALLFLESGRFQEFGGLLLSGGAAGQSGY